MSTSIETHQSPARSVWNRTAILAAAVLGGLVLVGGTASVVVQYLRETTESAVVQAPVRHVVVRVRDGNVQLGPSGGRVSIRSTMHYLFSKPDVTRTTDHGVLTVRATCDHSWLVDCSTDLRVSVPGGTAVDAETRHGDVTATDLNAGSIRVRTLDGGIRLHLANDPRLIFAHADDGGVSIDLPPARYAVGVEADEGETNVSGITRDDLAGRRIQATANRGDVNVRA